MLKVMVVDDEAMVRKAMQNLVPWDELKLSLIGNYGNAIEALYEMTEDMPDILITDVKMPVVSGIELIGKAKEMNPSLQCVIISGYDEFALAQAAMMEGVKYYLLKPCMKDAVVEVLQKCIKEVIRIKKEALRNCENRTILLDKLIQTIESLNVDENPEQCTAQLKAQLEYYGDDQELLREATVAIIAKYWTQDAAKDALNLIGKLHNVNLDLFESVAYVLKENQKMRSVDESFINKIRRYVDSHYKQSSLSLQSVADDVVNMNAKYVGKKFHEEMGIKFNDYLLKVRIEHAIDMLLSKKNYKMYEIADQVGLGNNMQYFYQLFKRYTGMTPGEYREANINRK